MILSVVRISYSSILDVYVLMHFVMVLFVTEVRSRMVCKEQSFQLQKCD